MLGSAANPSSSTTTAIGARVSGDLTFTGNTVAGSTIGVIGSDGAVIVGNAIYNAETGVQIDGGSDVLRNLLFGHHRRHRGDRGAIRASWRTTSTVSAALVLGGVVGAGADPPDDPGRRPGARGHADDPQQHHPRVDRRNFAAVKVLGGAGTRIVNNTIHSLETFRRDARTRSDRLPSSARTTDDLAIQNNVFVIPGTAAVSVDTTDAIAVSDYNIFHYQSLLFPDGDFPSVTGFIGDTSYDSLAAWQGSERTGREQHLDPRPAERRERALRRSAGARTRQRPARRG